MIINMTGGGGGGLNLHVVGGTARPSSPKENTVWVNTSTTINGYAFSATEPENPTEGMVWFDIGTASTAPINIDKKNTVMLYPINCSQCINGVWHGKTAEIYISGAWKSLNIYYYNEGNEYVDLTSGWALSTNGASSHGSSLTKGDSYMTFESSYAGGSHFAYGFLRSNEKIDLTTLKTVTVDISSANFLSGIDMYLCVHTNDTREAVLDSAGIAQIKGTGRTSLDVSSLNGSYYVGICANQGTQNGSSSVTVTSVEGTRK